MRVKSLFALGALILTGCSTALHTRRDLYHRAYLPQELGMFYYTGSSDAFHFFYKARFLRLDRDYRLPKSELSLCSEFRMTGDRTRWLYLTFEMDRLSLHGDRTGRGLGVVEVVDFDMSRGPTQTVERTGAQAAASDAK
jgi:hypothetical protein